MRLTERLSALRDELRADQVGGFGSGHARARQEDQAGITRLVNELQWFERQKKALLALVTDAGGLTRTVNPLTGEFRQVSYRASVDELIAQLEESYGELPSTFLLCLRRALIRGGYIEDVGAAEALDLVYRVPPKERARWAFRKREFVKW